MYMCVYVYIYITVYACVVLPCFLVVTSNVFMIKPHETIWNHLCVGHIYLLLVSSHVFIDLIAMFHTYTTWNLVLPPENPRFIDDVPIKNIETSIFSRIFPWKPPFCHSFFRQKTSLLRSLAIATEHSQTPGDPGARFRCRGSLHLENMENETSKYGNNGDEMGVHGDYVCISISISISISI